MALRALPVKGDLQVTAVDAISYKAMRLCLSADCALTNVPEMDGKKLRKSVRWDSAVRLGSPCGPNRALLYWGSGGSSLAAHGNTDWPSLISSRRILFLIHVCLTYTPQGSVCTYILSAAPFTQPPHNFTSTFFKSTSFTLRYQEAQSKLDIHHSPCEDDHLRA